MSKLITSIFICSVLSLSSCTTQHIYNMPDAAPEGDFKYIKAKAETFKGGKNLQNFDCDSNKIKTIQIDQNLGQTLFTVITLGTVWTLDVTYECAKVESEDGEM